MDIDVERIEKALIINVTGRLDGSNSREFELSVNSETKESDRSVILNLEGLEYISSAGLRAILLLTKSATSKGAVLALCKLPAQIDEVFKISGFDRIIPIHPTKEDALNAIG